MQPVNTITASYASTHIDRLGYIYHPEDMTYLCGIRLIGSFGESTFTSAYWTTNKDKAISVFDLCPVWKAASRYIQQSNISTETVIGYSSEIGTYTPWELYVVNGKYVCLCQDGISSKEVGMATAEWLYEELAPAKPVLKEQELFEYAFTVGTLCSLETTPPDWKPLIPKLMPKGYCCSVNGDDMDHYFRLGTTCKPGTSYEVIADMIGEVDGVQLRIDRNISPLSTPAAPDTARTPDNAPQAQVVRRYALTTHP